MCCVLVFDVLAFRSSVDATSSSLKFRFVVFMNVMDIFVMVLCVLSVDNIFLVFFIVVFDVSVFEMCERMVFNVFVLYWLMDFSCFCMFVCVCESD